MNFLQYYYEKVIKYDLINKFNYSNLNEIPKLKKIILNFGCKNVNIQKFASTFLALEIISNKKSTITIAKHPNVLLKIQKGQPAGCKVTLEKKLMYQFLTRLLIEILPKLKNFTGFKINIKTNTFFFQLKKNEIVLQDLEQHYPVFADLSHLDIHIKTNSKTSKELLFLIKSLKLPM